MSEPLVSVVIPSYNRRESVLTLLADVYRQEGILFEVIVVDDCSPDGSAEAIAQAFPQVTLLVNETNGGPCVARNRGIRAARSKIIVGLDSDVTVPDRTLLARTYQAFAELPANVHCLAFRLLQPDGITEDKARWWHPVPIEKFADKTFETSYFSGTGYALRRTPALAAGLFPEILYMHYEEVEFAWRILDHAGTIVHCPALPVLHHEHQVSRRSEIKTFYKARSQILIAFGCMPPLGGAKYLLPRLVNGAIHAVFGGYCMSFARAIYSACNLLPTRLSERKPLSLTTRKRIASLRVSAAEISPC